MDGGSGSPTECGEDTAEPLRCYAEGVLNRTGATLYSLLFLAACTPPAAGWDAGPEPDAGQDDAATPLDAGPIPDGPRADTDLGAVIGEDLGDVDVWRGIPYAAPPVGDLRFRPPARATPWASPRVSTAFGPICPQRERGGTAFSGDEDCLTLNVFAPRTRGSLPVMVFIHGGAFIQGAGSVALYDGASLARRGVVVVTLNYRLGALGFLATDELIAEASDGSAGNYGIQDQIAALEWVQRNADAFGGDASNVTIFGESAGGVSVCTLLGAPAADGLFVRGVVQSGGGCYAWPRLSSTTAAEPVSAVQRGVEIATAAGCTGADPLACLRALSAEAVVDATWSASTGGLGLPDIGPNVDGAVLPAPTWDRYADGSAVDRPVIIGSNADESRPFLVAVPIRTEAAYEAAVRATLPAVADELLALYPVSDYASPKAAYEALFSDVGFICPALSFARHAAGGAPAYTYHFVHTLRGLAARGAQHGDELFFIFDSLAIVPRYTPNPADQAVIDAMQTSWTSFARGEAPAGWPAYDPTSPTVRMFGGPADTQTSIRDDRCAALSRLGVVP